MPIDLEIVGPDKLLLSQSVDMVVIPGAEGDMGVLRDHAPMIVLLRGGTIRLFQGETVTERLFVSSGFAEVTPERVTVLVPGVSELAELSRSEANRLLAAAQADYEAADKTDALALELATDRILAAQAMLEEAQAD
jgi:F-type H+-transporting ATPase subunit epsilon